METGKYILINKIPIPEPDIIKWSKWIESSWDKPPGFGRRVAETSIGEIRVSTVFLCIDHGFIGSSPILFETLVFGGTIDGYMNRYYTWEEAKLGHRRIVRKVRLAQKNIVDLEINFSETS